ncbi:MAG: DUF1616 domain-containing protein [Methanomicrobiales archaeon]|jgi:uncharacterized membrane protein
MERAGPESRVFDILADAFFKEKVSLDLKAIFLWVMATVGAIYIPVLQDTPARVLLGLPVILFIPGYLLIATLFPGKRDLDTIERVALSFGLSIAIVPLVGLGLNYTPWGIRLDPIVISLVVFILVFAVLAHIRRAGLQASERYAPPIREVLSAARRELFPAESTRPDRILSVLLVLAIVAAIGTTIFVIAVPREGERFTEFSILGEKGMAGDYPTRTLAGKNNSMYIGIGNHEYRTVNYTVETYLLAMHFDEVLNTSRIDSMDMLYRFQVPVAHNETTILPYSFVVPGTGYNRIEFLLFNETVPDESITGMERINRSYRDLHLWLTVYPR